MILRFFIYCLAGAMLLPALSCRSLPEQRSDRLQRSQPLLGTFATITAYSSDRARLDYAVEAAFAEIRRVDALLSIHRDDSELARINRSAAAAPADSTAELWNLLQRAQAISSDTEGAFDITIGPVAQLWGFIWKEHRLPTASELERVLPLVDYRNLKLLPDRRIQFARDEMFLDPGGIGKGYAVDCAIEKLRSLSVSNAMVKIGGDLRVIGSPPGEDAWQVQIEDPSKNGQRSTIQLKDAALSTSGSYENFFEVSGQRYSHILNPKTGLPAKGVRQCTVIATTSTEADALATAFFVLGPERALTAFTNAIRFALDDHVGTVLNSANFPKNL